MFLVHDDQTEVVMGEEQGGPGAEDQVWTRLPDPGCHLRATCGGYARMEYLHVREYGRDAVFKLTGQGDFRDQDQDVPALSRVSCASLR